MCTGRAAGRAPPGVRLSTSRVESARGPTPTHKSKSILSHRPPSPWCARKIRQGGEQVIEGVCLDDRCCAGPGWKMSYANEFALSLVIVVRGRVSDDRVDVLGQLRAPGRQLVPYRTEPGRSRGRAVECAHRAAGYLERVQNQVPVCAIGTFDRLCSDVEEIVYPTRACTVTGFEELCKPLMLDDELAPRDRAGRQEEVEVTDPSRARGAAASNAAWTAAVRRARRCLSCIALATVTSGINGRSITGSRLAMSPWPVPGEMETAYYAQNPAQQPAELSHQ